MLYKILFPVLLFLLTAPAALAQDYLSGNQIRIYIEGYDHIYEYKSDNLMVRLNDDKSKIDCILMLETLVPANDSSPTKLAHDVFFIKKNQQFRFLIQAPSETLLAEDQQPIAFELPGVIFFQGRERETIFPTQFTPHKYHFQFRSEFDFSIQQMEGTLPRKYMTVLTGKIKVLVLNATWMKPPNTNSEIR